MAPLLTTSFALNATFLKMFLRGMPHLCEKMRRLTYNKGDAKKTKGEDEITPDFYALSQSFQLPEDVQPPSITTCPVVMPSFPASQFDTVGKVLLEQHRALILDHFKLLSSSNLTTSSLGLVRRGNVNGMSARSVIYPANQNQYVQPQLMGISGLLDDGAHGSPPISVIKQLLQASSQNQHNSLAQLLAMKQRFSAFTTFGDQLGHPKKY